MKETSKPVTSPKTPAKSGENVGRAKGKLSSMAQIGEIDESSNEVLENYERNAVMMDTTLKKLRRRNNELLYAYIEALSSLDTMHRTSFCVERYLAPSLKEKIKERDALQEDMDEIMKEDEVVKENNSWSDDFHEQKTKVATENPTEKLESTVETSAAASDTLKSHQSESEVNTPEVSVDQDLQESHTKEDAKNKSETSVESQQKHRTSDAIDELAKNEEATDIKTLIFEPLKKNVETGKEGVATTDTPIAIRLEDLKKKLNNLRKRSENNLKTLFQMVSENPEMGKCFNIQDMAKIKEQFEMAQLIARENQKALQKYKSEQCEIKQEISSLFKYVYTTKLKEANAKLDQRIKQLELDLLGEIEAEKIVDANMKRLGVDITMLTAEYRVMELRVDQLPVIEETCKDFGEVLTCRQGSLADKEEKIEELKNLLSEKKELNKQKLKKLENRRNYVRTAQRTISECAQLIERAMQGINCADSVAPISFSMDLYSLVQLTDCSDSTKTLQQTKLIRFSEDSKTLVENETKNTCQESNTLAQNNLIDYCDNRRTLGSTNLSDSSCEDSKDLIRTVLKKLRHLLPLIGDPVTSLSYLLKDVTVDNEDDGLKFSILDLQMYQQFAN